MKKVEYNGTTYFIDRDLIGTEELKQAIKDIVERKFYKDEIEAYTYKNIFAYVKDDNTYYIHNSKNTSKSEARSFRYREDNKKVENSKYERRIITNE